ncbi:uncharacterized protein VTP21DRAFT_5445 [Calcarisporiella thermophila]|uniref:uncharacterized protein n=1 Tax=Calcarisporiella thermophila TaxID=911321 RepID=UPI003744A37D
MLLMLFLIGMIGEECARSIHSGKINTWIEGIVPSRNIHVHPFLMRRVVPRQEPNMDQQKGPASDQRELQQAPDNDRPTKQEDTSPVKKSEETTQNNGQSGKESETRNAKQEDSPPVKESDVSTPKTDRSGKENDSATSKTTQDSSPKESNKPSGNDDRAESGKASVSNNLPTDTEQSGNGNSPENTGGQHLPIPTKTSDTGDSQVATPTANNDQGKSGGPSITGEDSTKPSGNTSSDLESQNTGSVAPSDGSSSSYVSASIATPVTSIATADSSSVSHVSASLAVTLPVSSSSNSIFGNWDHGSSTSSSLHTPEPLPNNPTITTIPSSFTVTLTPIPVTTTLTPSPATVTQLLTPENPAIATKMVTEVNVEHLPQKQSSTGVEVTLVTVTAPDGSIVTIVASRPAILQIPTLLSGTFSLQPIFPSIIFIISMLAIFFR